MPSSHLTVVREVRIHAKWDAAENPSGYYEEIEVPSLPVTLHQTAIDPSYYDDVDVSQRKP